MTPQLTLVSKVAPGRSGTEHLTEDQFGELLSESTANGDPALASANAHLLVCAQCAAELTSLRESLSLFRDASHAHADSELRHMPQVTLPVRGTLSPSLTPAYWLAAAALLLAAILPIQSLRQHSLRAVPAAPASVSSSTSESDEALLEDVDSTTSASVPAPMQALADPTGSTSTASITSTSVQRKD